MEDLFCAGSRHIPCPREKCGQQRQDEEDVLPLTIYFFLEVAAPCLLFDMLCDLYPSIDQYPLVFIRCPVYPGVTRTNKKQIYHLLSVDYLASQGVSVKEIRYQKRFFSQLRDHHFELAIDLRTGTRGAVLSYLSGAPHIAAAVDTPTISIFGPLSSQIWAPRGESHRVIRKDWSCVPCGKKGCQGSEVSRCLDELTVEEVKNTVNDQLSIITSPSDFIT